MAKSFGIERVDGLNLTSHVAQRTASWSSSSSGLTRSSSRMTAERRGARGGRACGQNGAAADRAAGAPAAFAVRCPASSLRDRGRSDGDRRAPSPSRTLPRFALPWTWPEPRATSRSRLVRAPWRRKSWRERVRSRGRLAGSAACACGVRPWPESTCYARVRATRDVAWRDRFTRSSASRSQERDEREVKTLCGVEGLFSLP